MHGKVLKLGLETHSILSSLNILFHINICHITEASSSISFTRTENESLPVTNDSTLDVADLISPANCDNRCASLNIEYRSQGKILIVHSFLSLCLLQEDGNRVSILYPDSNLENDILTVAIS